MIFTKPSTPVPEAVTASGFKVVGHVGCAFPLTDDKDRQNSKGLMMVLPNCLDERLGRKRKWRRMQAVQGGEQGEPKTLARLPATTLPTNDTIVED